MNREVLSQVRHIDGRREPMATTEHAVDMTHEETGQLNMLFQFEHMDLDRGPGNGSAKWTPKRWDLLDLKRVMTRWQKDLEGQGLEQPVPVQPRPAALRFPFRRRRPVPGGVGQAAGDVPAHAARHALYLSGRRDRHDQRPVRRRSTTTATSKRSTCTGRSSRAGGSTRAPCMAQDPRQEPRQRPHAHAVGRQRRMPASPPARPGSA